MNKELIVISGPTAVGKTSLAINLANEINTEIISADSRQFYKELNIGVARPSQKELNSIKHHFIGHISIQDNYNAGEYEAEAIEKINSLFQKYDKLVITGGSGMYIDAITKGMDNLPNVDKSIREELNELFKDNGITPLQEELMEKDIEYYNIVDKQNHIRLIRALEIIRQTGKTFTSFRTNPKKKRDFKIKKFVLIRDREELIQRINQRVDIMVEEGLIEEARELYPFRDLNALNTVGYKELFKYFDKKISLKEAIEEIKINTRKYAKRQVTWFRKDKDYTWLSADKEINWKEVLHENI
ncbi:MAG: tRNA (adenosine(37)-N6)-dimethylallyltransferase MiaA [Bacteroidales bacterium]|jgi:tRNA dimethylallyltransferase|nr:tRNA (adenosine(37)-N6)-dimethylallyltransferase MiaA [Bacteroidales bacterium]